MTNIYLAIQAHAGTANIEYLLKTFDKPGFLVGLHVDLKTPLAPFKEVISQFPRAELLEPRLDHIWGAWEILQVQINALKHCSSRPDISHVVFISADSIPLKSPKEIRDFFQSRSGKSLLSAQLWLPKNRPNRHSHTYFHPIQRFLLKRKWERLRNWSARLFPRKESKFRHFPKDWQIWFGRGWYAIAAQHINGILEFCDGDESKGAKYFKGTLIPEEHTFQTYLFNSLPANEIENQRMMYADYSIPRPPVLTQEQLNRLAQGGQYLFARKVPLVEKKQNDTA